MVYSSQGDHQLLRDRTGLLMSSCEGGEWIAWMPTRDLVDLIVVAVIGPSICRCFACCSAQCLVDQDLLWCTDTLLLINLLSTVRNVDNSFDLEIQLFGILLFVHHTDRVR